MKISKIREKILENWPAKTVCFVIALVIYFFHQISDLDKKNFVIPVTVLENGSTVVVSNVTDGQIIRNVKVTVRTDRSSIASITEDDFKAYVDLTLENREGEYSYPVYIEQGRKLFNCEILEVTVKPENIKLKVERKISGLAQIKPSVSGTPAYGFEISRLECEPSAVKISGPRSLVESTKTLETEAFLIDGVTKDVVGEVEVENFNSLLSMDENPAVTVTAYVNPSVITREFSSVPVEIRNVPEGFEAKCYPAFINVAVEGEMLVLEGNPKPVIKAYIDCSEISFAEEGMHNLGVYVYNVPKNAKVSAQSSYTVSLELENKMEEVEESGTEASPLNAAEGSLSFAGSLKRESGLL